MEKNKSTKFCNGEQHFDWFIKINTLLREKYISEDEYYQLIKIYIAYIRIENRRNLAEIEEFQHSIETGNFNYSSLKVQKLNQMLIQLWPFLRDFVLFKDSEDFYMGTITYNNAKLCAKKEHEELDRAIGTLKRMGSK